MKESIACLHYGDAYDDNQGAIVPPLYQNTLFTRKNQSHRYSYTRIDNPTLSLLEEKLAALEGGEQARVFASGMGAITAVLMSLLKKGDHIIAVRGVYPPVLAFIGDTLGELGIGHALVDGRNTAELDEALQPGTRVVYLESPSSNLFGIQDIAAIAQWARHRGITCVIDNSWATPLYQKPLSLGADVVVHSASKYLGGHSDVCTGVAVGSAELMEHIRHHARAQWGACLDPFAGWLLLRSLRTLHLRMVRHSATAAAVAAHLAAHSQVAQVYWPGLSTHPQHALAARQMGGYSGVMGLTLKAGADRAVPFVKQLSLFEEGPSWGGYESMANTPGVGADSRWMRLARIPSGLIRLSIGLEDAEDLIADLDTALAAL